MSENPFPPLSVSDVANCALPVWYSRFRNISIKSIILEIPDEVVKYLLADGVFLPLDRNGQPQPSYRNPESADDGMLSDDDNDSENGGENTWGAIPHFPEFQDAVDAAIEALGGLAFPKLDWSAPKARFDASWISLGQTLRCKTAADVFLLLKSSDFVVHDLTCPFEACNGESVVDKDIGTLTPDQYHLVLRKWYDMHPSMEFRCFVKNNQLVGMCQRDCMNFYPFLVSLKPALQAAITEFFEREICGKFMNSSFVLDVYVNKGNHKVWLVDFNPLSPNTDSLMFSWEEILGTGNSDGTMHGLRIVTRAEDVAPGAMGTRYMHNRLPKDAFDFAEHMGMGDGTLAAQMIAGLQEAGAGARPETETETQTYTQTESEQEQGR